MAGEREVKKRFAIALDIARPVSNREFTVVEGDNGNELVITLTDAGTPVELTDCRVLALFSKSDGTTVSQDSGTQNNGVSIGGDDDNVVTVELFPGSFSPGMVECELQVYSGPTNGLLVTSAKFNFVCRRGILNSDTIAAVEQYPILTALMTDVALMQSAQEVLTAAEALRVQAESARAAAEEERDAAEGVRDAAESGRAAAEDARESAEAARATAEAERAGLQAGLAAAAASSEELLAALNDAVEALPELLNVEGLVKGDGEGGMTAALAGTDYAAPAVDYTATLSATWTGSTAPYTQTVAIIGLPAGAKTEVGLASNITAEQYAAALAAQLMCTAQAAGQITVTAFGTAPAVAIPISVRVVG